MKDMQSGCLEYNITDLWATDKPAFGINGTGEFEEFVFRDHIVDIVQKHDPNDPLFMMYAPHVAHCPLQVPQEWFNAVGTHAARMLWGRWRELVDRQPPFLSPLLIVIPPRLPRPPPGFCHQFDFMEDDESLCSAQSPYVGPRGSSRGRLLSPRLIRRLVTSYIWPGNTNVTNCRQIYHSMVFLLDSVIGDIVSTLKAKGFWDDLLVVSRGALDGRGRRVCGRGARSKHVSHAIAFLLCIAGVYFG